MTRDEAAAACVSATEVAKSEIEQAERDLRHLQAGAIYHGHLSAAAKAQAEQVFEHVGQIVMKLEQDCHALLRPWGGLPDQQRETIRALLGTLRAAWDRALIDNL